MFFALFLATEVLLLGMGDSVVTTADADELISIRDDSSGGGCSVIGKWNAATKTCTLDRDIAARLTVDSDGITIDGDSYTIVGNATENLNDAITVASRYGVTIKNVNFEEFSYGVHLINSSLCTVSNTTATGNLGAGISLSGASNNTIINNQINNFSSVTGICIGFASTNNIISGNTVTGADRGIYLHDFSNGNTISGNALYTNLNAITLYDSDSLCIIKDNTISTNAAAVYLHGASTQNSITGNTISSNSSGLNISNGANNNRIYHNNFMSNVDFQANVSGGTGNTFNEASPAGGNYWADFDTPAEGCNDLKGTSKNSPYIT